MAGSPRSHGAASPRHASGSHIVLGGDGPAGRLRIGGRGRGPRPGDWPGRKRIGGSESTKRFLCRRSRPGVHTRETRVLESGVCRWKGRGMCAQAPAGPRGLLTRLYISRIEAISKDVGSCPFGADHDIVSRLVPEVIAQRRSTPRPLPRPLHLQRLSIQQHEAPWEGKGVGWQ